MFFAIFLKYDFSAFPLADFLSELDIL